MNIDTSIVELKWRKTSVHQPDHDGLYLVALRIRLANDWHEDVDFSFWDHGKWTCSLQDCIEVTAFAEVPNYPKELNWK